MITRDISTFRECFSLILHFENIYDCSTQDLCPVLLVSDNIFWGGSATKTLQVNMQKDREWMTAIKTLLFTTKANVREIRKTVKLKIFWWIFVSLCKLSWHDPLSSSLIGWDPSYWSLIGRILPVQNIFTGDNRCCLGQGVPDVCRSANTQTLQLWKRIYLRCGDTPGK